MKKAYLREASPSDAELLFEWANDVEVRKKSFSTGEITYEEHMRWFRNILENDRYRQYIYVYSEVEIGQIRIETDGSNAEIGYSICAGRRGKGHGKCMIQLLKEKLKTDFPEVKNLIAKVKSGNMASQRVFEESGFEELFRQYVLKVEQQEQ